MAGRVLAGFGGLLGVGADYCVVPGQAAVRSSHSERVWRGLRGVFPLRHHRIPCSRAGDLFVLVVVACVPSFLPDLSD